MDFGIGLNTTNPIVRRRASLPMEALNAQAQEFAQNFDTALENEDMLSASLDIDSADFEGDKKLLNNIQQKYRERIAERATKGDYENQLRFIRKDALEFQKDIQPILQNKQALQEYSKEIDKRVREKEIDGETATLAKRISFQNYNGLDPDNPNSTIFQGYKPLPKVDLGDELDSFINQWKATGGEQLGYVYDREGNAFKSKISGKSVNEAEVLQAGKKMLSNRFGDYINEQVQLRTANMTDAQKELFLTKTEELYNQQNLTNPKTNNKAKVSFQDKDFNTVFRDLYLTEQVAPYAAKASFNDMSFSILNPDLYTDQTDNDVERIFGQGVDSGLLDNVVEYQELTDDEIKNGAATEWDDMGLNKNGGVKAASDAIFGTNFTGKTDEEVERQLNYNRTLEATAKETGRSAKELDREFRNQSNLKLTPFNNNELKRIKTKYTEGGSSADMFRRPLTVISENGKVEKTNTVKEAYREIFGTTDINEINKIIKEGGLDPVVVGEISSAFNSLHASGVVLNYGGKRVIIDTSLEINKDSGIRAEQHRIYRDVITNGGSINGKYEIKTTTYIPTASGELIKLNPGQYSRLKIVYHNGLPTIVEKPVLAKKD